MARMGSTSHDRVDWVDYAKGFCIIMVVMMHSTLGVEAAAGREGWMHVFVAFAKPFRMPDFFMISGLFLARVIDRDWRNYLDKKVVHFAYFYVLWVTIQFAFKAPGLAAEHGTLGVVQLYAEAFIEPIRFKFAEIGHVPRGEIELGHFAQRQCELDTRERSRE